MKIREATVEDAEKLLEIYAYYVENTAISFEYDTPGIEEFSGRIANTLKKFPYLVLEDDDEILGYAYAGAFHPRAAYSHCVEMTVYLKNGSSGRGYGRMLYEELEKRLKAMNIKNLYACIADPVVEDEFLTKNSEKFHAHMGYTKCGDFHKCGYKFGRWYNMIWMEKMIDD